jgi:type VI secretion system protein
MGEFEVQVAFAETKRPPLADRKSLVQALVSDDVPALAEDLPPPEPGLFDEPTYMGPAAVRPAPAPKPIQEKPKPTLESTAPRGPAVSAAETPMQNALRMFLAGAGVPEKPLTAEQSEKLLRESGAMLRAAVEGLMTLLVACGEMRREFQGQEGDNNPLQRMGKPQEAMDFLFEAAARSQSSLLPVEAIANAADELRAHDAALMAAVPAAVLAAVRRFDAQILENAFDKSAGGFSFGGRKAKMWELFLAYQEKLSQDAQEDFDKVFGGDFKAAYEAQLRRLKPR